MSQHVCEGLIVEVNSGKYRGQRGKIVKVLAGKQRVRIEGIAVVKRHLKQSDGGITEKLGSVHISNVQPIDPVSKKRTRVRHVVGQNGRRIRISQRSGEPLSEL